MARRGRGGRRGDAAGRAPAGGRTVLLSGAILFLFFVSGSLGLIYQVVWLRMLILIFGSTHFAVSTVLTAFMAGLALGAYVVGRQIDRRWDPLVVYGVFEIAIGVYALAIPWLFSLLTPVSRWLWGSFEPTFYTFSILRFFFVGAVLILPTSLMGGTLPALSRFVTRRTERMGLSVGSLYSVNTFGAVAGTAATGFVLVPWLGVQRTIWLAAGLNVAVGLVSLGLWAVARRRLAGAGEPAAAGAAKAVRHAAATAGAGTAATAGPADLAPPEPGALPLRVKVALAAFALSGFVAMIYEIAWTRVLALIIGSSVYAFTIMLTTFLVGLAAGASLMSGLADRIGARRGMEGIAALLAGTGATAYVTLAFFHNLPYWFTLAFHAIEAESLTEESQGLLFGVQFLLAAVVMLPPTLFLGGMFPLVVRICAAGLERVGRTVGTAYAANTVGTIFGSALGGFLVVPLLGIQGSIIAAIVADMIMAGAILVLPAARVAEGPSSRRRLVAAGLCAAGAVTFVVIQPGWDVLLMNSGMYAYATSINAGDMTPESFRRSARRGNDLIFYEEGVTATVMVARDEGVENIFLSVDGKVDASSHIDIQTQLLSAHIPMLMARRTADVLVIGYASGMTVGAASLHDIDSLTAVEIEPAVIRASREFTAYNYDPLSNPDVEVVVGDGRNFLLVTDRKFEVIISEPSNPWMTIASNLFTREFFEIGKSRLKPGGVFCGWVQLYGLPPDLLRAMIRTFSEVYPHVSVFMPIPFADLILLGSEKPLAPDLERIGARMADPGVAADLERIEVERPADILSFHTMGDAEARRFAGRGPLNTDDNALIEFEAPLALYAGTRMENAKALVPYLSDPLERATGLGGDPAARAAVYDRLAEAFFRREIAGRAFTAFSKAQELDASEARARRIQEVREWFTRELRRRQAMSQGGGG